MKQVRNIKSKYTYETTTEVLDSLCIPYQLTNGIITVSDKNHKDQSLQAFLKINK